MPLRIEKQFSNNWSISQEVISALQEHASCGQYNEHDLVFIGDSRKIDIIVSAFRKEVLCPIVATARLYAKKTCTDGSHGKWHAISLYLRKLCTSGQELETIQAVWTPARKIREEELVKQIDAKFAPSKVKYVDELLTAL